MKTGTDLEPGTRGELVRKKTYVGPPFEALNVRDAAAIIAGCSVGGGFLALPTVRAEPPPPFPPSWPHMPSLHEVFPRLPADPRIGGGQRTNCTLTWSRQAETKAE